MNRSKITLALFFLTLITACSHKNAPLTSSMNTEGLHHKWKVLNMKDAATNLPDIYIDLRDVHRSGATAGCQYFSFVPNFGHHTKIKIDNISAHLASCGDGKVDELLFNNLKNATTFSVTNNDLKLLAADGSVLFTAQKSQDDENGSLKRKWLIKEMINGDAEQLIKDNAFIDLTDLEKASASVGCNRFSFGVTADDTYNINIAKAISTRMFCKDAALNESVFNKTLPLISKYQVIGNRLKLFDKANTLLMEAEESL